MGRGFWVVVGILIAAVIFLCYVVYNNENKDEAKAKQIEELQKQVEKLSKKSPARPGDPDYVKEPGKNSDTP